MAKLAKEPKAPKPDKPPKAAKEPKAGKPPKQGKNGTAAPPPKAEKPPTEKEAKEKEGKMSMIARIEQLWAKASSKKPMTRGETFDILKVEYPDKKDSDISMWINYSSGYLNQKGHTVHSEGRGAERKFWLIRMTHEPHGRFAPKEKKPSKNGSK